MEPDSAKKLLYVSNTISYCLHRLPLAVAAKKMGFSVHMAAPDGKEAHVITDNGLHYHKIFMPRKTFTPWTEIKSLLSLSHLYKVLRPDLIHHFTIKPMIYGSLAARMLGNTPCVVNAVTGMGYAFTRQDIISRILYGVVVPAYRLAFRLRRHMVIFQNQDDRDFFLNRQIVKMENTTIIKGSGVNTEEFQIAPEPSGTPIVMMASRMLHDKGVEEFVTAASLLKQEGVTARFVLVGDIDEGNHSTISRKQLAEWSQSDNVEWWGHQEHMSSVLAQTSIVCLPSYREGIPRILIEAGACEKPLIASDVPGCRDVVRHGDNGLLVPIRNASALAEAIQKLLADRDLCAQMGRRGRQIVEQEFSEESIISQTVAIYEEMLL